MLVQLYCEIITLYLMVLRSLWAFKSSLIKIMFAPFGRPRDVNINSILSVSFLGDSRGGDVMVKLA